MVGWVFSGKSASGNTIFKTDMFQAGEKTEKASKQSGEVAGREVIIVDTPGWWKFLPATFTPLPLKAEILNGVSLCSPSPNVILLVLPLDSSFTDDQRRLTEDNMRLLGQRVWRHVIVLFTYGDTLGEKTVEQHIESEGKPLRWLIEKCGNRYHVLNNMSTDDYQVRELLEKMEEMVAGNSFFYLSAYPDGDYAKHQEDRSEYLTNIKDETTTKKITEQLAIEWDRKNWEKHRCEGSIGLPPGMSEAKQSSQGSEGEEVQMEHEDDQFRSCFGPEVDSEDDAGSGPLNILRELMEREWHRREVCMEQAFWRQFYNPAAAPSEPDNDQLLKSREKVRSWLKRSTSGFGTASNTSNQTKEDSICSGQEPC
uniref:AIG1-type G domain-containing protein n=1 Tax=Sparus aurata TaxID=8175 RepID=A0A671YVU5_SPAAU